MNNEWMNKYTQLAKETNNCAQLVGLRWNVLYLAFRFSAQAPVVRLIQYIYIYV
jgi:hypothetical protein